MPQFDKIDPRIWDNVRVQDTGQKLDCLVWCQKGTQDSISCGDIIGRYPFLSAAGINTTYKHIYSLSDDLNVRFISSVQKAFVYMYQARSCVGVESLHDKRYSGKGTTIAVIDTGCDMHLDLVLGRNRIVRFVDFVNASATPYDDNGHGTFVCGVLGGNGLCSNSRYRGVAPQCDIIVLKSLNQNGETQVFTILNAMQWIIDHKIEYNIKVVCMSFGSEPYTKYDPLALGAEALWDNGIVVVCASGNDGPQPNTVKSPAISPKVLSVGSCNANAGFVQSDFSSFGVYDGITKPEILAPGENINSLGNSGPYVTMSGTSVSTPIVAGVVALLLEQNPNLTPNQIKNILISTSMRDKTGQHLIVNAYKAINYLKA